MAIGCGLGDFTCREHAACPDAVLDHDRLVPLLAQFVRHKAGEHVGRPARSEADDDAHRLAGVGRLRVALCDRAKRECECDQYVREFCVSHPDPRCEGREGGILQRQSPAVQRPGSRNPPWFARAHAFAALGIDNAGLAPAYGSEHLMLDARRCCVCRGDPSPLHCFAREDLFAASGQAAFLAQRSRSSQPPMCSPLTNTWGTVPLPVIAPTIRLRLALGSETSE